MMMYTNMLACVSNGGAQRLLVCYINARRWQRHTYRTLFTFGVCQAYARRSENIRACQNKPIESTLRCRASVLKDLSAFGKHLRKRERVLGHYLYARKIYT